MGPGSLEAVIVPVDLSKPNLFHDIPDIPERYHRRFRLSLPDDASTDPDFTVSESIINMGIWEPWETMFLSSAFAAADDSTVFIDLGAHIGWFSALAASWGMWWYAYEYDHHLMRHLRWLAKRTKGTVTQCWIDDNWVFGYVYDVSQLIVKMDLEGNEECAVRALWPYFAGRTITHCMMEISPVFNDSYPMICSDLIGLGYEAWVMPEKQLNPPAIGLRFKDYVKRYSRGLHEMDLDVMSTWLEKQHQINVMFSRPEAKWG